MNLNSFNQTGTAGSLNFDPLRTSNSREEGDEDPKAPTYQEKIREKSDCTSNNDFNQTQKSFQAALHSNNENLPLIQEECKPYIQEERQNSSDSKDKVVSKSSMRDDNPGLGIGFDGFSDVTNRLSETNSETSSKFEGFLPESRELNEYEKGTQKEEHRHFEEAEKLYREMIQKNPDFGQAYAGLGSVLTKQRKFEEARIYCKKALELGQTEIRLFYAITFLEEGKYKKGINILEICEDSDERDHLLGCAYDNLKDYDEAEKYFQKACDKRKNLGTAGSDKQGKSYARSLIRLALVQLRKGDFEKAESNLKLAQKHGRKKILAFRYYGIILCIQNNREEAQKMYDEGLDIARASVAESIMTKADFNIKAETVKSLEDEKKIMEELLGIAKKQDHPQSMKTEIEYLLQELYSL